MAALKELSASEPRKATQTPQINDLMAAARAEAATRAARRQRAELEIELALALERAATFETPERLTDARSPRPWRKLRDWLVEILRKVAGRRDDSSEAARDPRKSGAELGCCGKGSAHFLAPRSSREGPGLQRMRRTKYLVSRVLPRSRPILMSQLGSFCSIEIKELEFGGVTKSRKLLAEDARLLLRHRPIWAISTLSVPSRVPLVAGLFDYVIIDEAGQCDIASALPLIARAKNAVVVGDPLQLSFIPQLSRQQEHGLMDAAGLKKSGRHAIAQSLNSIFDFAAKRPNSRQYFLSDQFRSAPGIVDYINDEFYDGQLVARRDDTDLRTPRDYKPGLDWHDVKGRPSREDGGNVNLKEAAAVATLVVDMIRNRRFDGTIGVLSPFDAQVGKLSRLLREGLSAEEQQRVSLKIATIDKFQGGEADVILFSPVIGDGADFGLVNFLKRERRRLNVAISRARALCIVVGDLDYALKSDIPHLRRLAFHAKSPYSPPRAAFDSEWERRLYEAMRRIGLEPHPQYPIGRKYLDFALFAGVSDEIKLDVEVDGRAFHTDADGYRKVGDVLRDKELMGRGWKVRRFWVSELNYDMGGCLARIESDLRQP